MTELRCHQSMERQKVRKDYDLLTAQLEELSKKESYSKIYANVIFRIFMFIPIVGIYLLLLFFFSRTHNSLRTVYGRWLRKGNIK